jgi:hypothetical protein
LTGVPAPSWMAEILNRLPERVVERVEQRVLGDGVRVDHDRPEAEPLHAAPCLLGCLNWVAEVHRAGADETWVAAAEVVQPGVVRPPVGGRSRRVERGHRGHEQTHAWVQHDGVHAAALEDQPVGVGREAHVLVFLVHLPQPWERRRPPDEEVR